MKEEMFDKKNCFFRIQSMLESLKAAEKRAATFILENPEKAITLTMEELAERSGVSYATINRLCRKIGYMGYKDFKNSLVYDVLYKKDVDDAINELVITPGTSTKEVCENVYNLAYKVLEDSMSVIDVDVVETVADKLLNAEKVCFLGSGASGITAKYAYSRFFRIGINSSYEPDATLYMMNVALLKEGDVLFAVSSSGRTEKVVEAVRMAKKQNVTIVSLSDFAISPLSKISDYNLFTTSRSGGKFMNIDMPLITGQMTIIDILYTCCCVKMGGPASEKYEITKSCADAEKIK